MTELNLMPMDLKIKGAKNTSSWKQEDYLFHKFNTQVQS